MDADGHEPFIYAELTGINGGWIYRSYVPNFAQPDALIRAYADIMNRSPPLGVERLADRARPTTGLGLATSASLAAAYLEDSEINGRSIRGPGHERLVTHEQIGPLVTNMNLVGMLDGTELVRIMEGEESRARQDGGARHAFIVAAFSVGFGVMLALAWFAVMVCYRRQLAPAGAWAGPPRRGPKTKHGQLIRTVASDSALQ
jgi:hypothetical protein